MIRKLRLKFILVNMSIVLVMLGVIFGLVFHFTRSGLENQNIQMMHSLATQPFKPVFPERNRENAPEDIRLPFFILHVGPDGAIQTTNGGYYDLTDESFLNEMVEIVSASPKEYGVIAEYNLRYFKNEIPGNKSYVFSDISSERSVLKDMSRNCVMIGILSFVLFLIISILLSKWAVRPVEKAWNGQRQFVADASHELKTPLAVIMANADLALGTYGDGPENRQFLKNIRTMSEHMKVLVEQMLELSRTDRQMPKADKKTVDLSEVAEGAVMSFEAMLFEKGHEMRSEVEPKLMVKGHEGQLSQVIEILLDNAGKYASENGRIFLTLKKKGYHQCLLTVSNEGPAIPKAELEHIFKRFYRTDTARTRDGSFGLGLSIAENIVMKHKGRIWAESGEGLNSFHVLLPMCRS